MVHRRKLIPKHHQYLIHFYQTQVFLTLLYLSDNGKCYACSVGKFLLCKLGFFPFAAKLNDIIICFAVILCKVTIFSPK